MGSSYNEQADRKLRSLKDRPNGFRSNRNPRADYGHPTRTGSTSTGNPIPRYMVIRTHRTTGAQDIVRGPNGDLAGFRSLHKANRYADRANRGASVSSYKALPREQVSRRMLQGFVRIPE